MSNFVSFATAVVAQLSVMQKGELFTAAVEKDEIWDAYLAAFPEGSNPIFRVRTEHDGSYDRNFIKNLGRVLAIKDGALVSVWAGFADLPYPYDVVASKLDALVRSAGIKHLFRSKESAYGSKPNWEQVEGDDPILWNHFYGQVAPAHFTKTPEAVIGEANSHVQVFRRGLNEISGDAVQSVLDLIAQGSLYRGDEFRAGVASFQKMQKAYLKLSSIDREVYIWSSFNKPGARIRNTSIGQLLQDLSEGKELEASVAAFEKMVAPENYKRTTALITPAMIKNATTTLAELGLTSAIERRHATLADVSINDVIWADGSAKAVMRDGLADLLLSSGQVKPAKSKKATDISITDFMSQVVPSMSSLELLLANSLTNNLMSITAPVHANAGKLFKWNNQFAWSYNGNITDSIKEKVKRAGGNTNAQLRVSLAWFNPDDLDIHCYGPEGHISYADKKGVLDLDMNAFGKSSATDPVENLQWAKPRDGSYEVKVNQYNSRTKDRPGFVIEVENAGKVTQYSYAAAVKGTVDAIKFTVKGGMITELTVGKGLIGQGIQQDVWGLKTEQFVKVNTLMFSPNFWEGNATGNKHWFFLLEGAVNDQPVRGIYNEYLRDELTPHRKVFEVLGAKTMCPVVDQQLSGLGFSSTRGDTVTASVVLTTGEQKTFNIHF